MFLNRKKSLFKNKIIILSLIIIVLVVCIAGCTQTGSQTSVTKTASTGTTGTTTPTASDTTPATQTTIPGHTISVQDAKNILDTDKMAVFIDVRNQTSFDEDHISGAILIPVDTIANNLSEIPKDKQVIVYAQCH